MTETKSISNSLEQTLKTSDLENIAISFSEIVIDSFIDNGIVKDIPIVSTIIGLGKSAVGIKETLFLKKIMSFIYELKNIKASKRREMIEKIDQSKKYKIRVGEKLLYIIDKCDDYEKSQLVALFFRAYINGTITYDEFLKAAHILNSLVIDDIKRFIEKSWEKETDWENDEHRNYEYGFIKIDFVRNLATSGLFKIVSPEISVEDQWDHKADDKYIVNGSELFVRITDIGEIIKDILENSFYKK